MILTGLPDLEAKNRSFRDLERRTSVTLIDRPVRIKSLISTTQSVLTARQRQYEVRELMQKNLAVYAMSLAGVPHGDRRRAQADIAAWAAMPGRLLSVAGRFPLYETAAAHQAVERGGKVGTVVVEPQR